VALLKKTPRRRALVMDGRHVLGLMLRESSEYNVNEISVGNIWGVACRVRMREEMRVLKGRKG
jgi:hypothetical protein